MNWFATYTDLLITCIIAAWVLAALILVTLRDPSSRED